MKWILCLLVAFLALGCGNDSQPTPPAADGAAKVKLALNWKPEPEFGGFYAAQESGVYAGQKLSVDITSGGDQVPQMLAAGKVEFGILAADEVVTARSKGIDLVGLFAVYQTNPQGILTHAKRNFTSLADVMNNPGTLAVQPGLPYVAFLKNLYPQAQVKIVPYDFSIVQFMNDPNHSQQCFITSEPISAQRKGASTKVFLIAESGFNPYAVVVAARGDYVRSNADLVQRFVSATTRGWQQYLAEPARTNEVMHKLNREMDLETFGLAAEAQKSLIDDGKTPVGHMSEQRWQTLIEQLSQLKSIDRAPTAAECLQNPPAP